MSRVDDEGGRPTTVSQPLDDGAPMSRHRATVEVAARVRSFRDAGRGLRALLSSEPNAWIHAAATGLVLFFGFLFSISWIEWCVVILAISAVWCAEAINTAIELLADATAPGPHPLVGKAKDVAAGGVLATAIGAAIVGLLVFVPHIVVWWHGGKG